MGIELDLSENFHLRHNKYVATNYTSKKPEYKYKWYLKSIAKKTTKKQAAFVDILSKAIMLTEENVSPVP